MSYLATNIKKIPVTAFYLLLPTLTIVVSCIFAYYLLFPTFSNLIVSANQLKAKKTELNQIKGSINSLSQLNEKEVANFALLLDKLIPSDFDMIRFASLNQKIANSAKVQIVNISTSKMLPGSLDSSAGVENPDSTKDPNASGTGGSVKAYVTYSSSFESLLTLVKLWSEADLFAGVNSISVSSSVAGPLTYTITYDVFTAEPATGVSVQEFKNLTQEDREVLKELASKISFVATPSAKPVGKTNPFE